jgi:Fe-S cluster assembly ATPase SufC
MVIFCVFVVLYLASIVFQRYIERIQIRWTDLTGRALQYKDFQRRAREQKDKLNRIRPKLQIIQQRVVHMQSITSNSSEANACGSSTGNGKRTLRESILGSKKSHHEHPVEVCTDGEVFFNVWEFFDALDHDGNGILSYDELNRVLQLEPAELHDFVRRMNTLDADEPTDSNHVTKSTFVHHFLDVLEETSNFRLTPQEAGSRWDEMATEFGTNTREEIALEHLYESSVASFLSDVQINRIVHGLRDMTSDEISWRKGQSRRKLSRKPSTVYDYLGGFANASAGFINRDNFCEFYPKVLEEILMKAATAVDNVTEKKGIDIAFKNLQLAVKVGRNKSINVVDSVTGRIRKGAMTAILGGSGAGKTSLLNALCGRAYYGEVKGEVFINGNKASIEEFTDSIGFVPQVSCPT